MILTRRRFSQLAACTAIAPALGSASTRTAAVTPEVTKSRVVLEPFNYEGVHLLDGMLARQFQAAKATYYNIPNDSMLFGFRQRAGLPAPGTGLDGWYGDDTFNAFGQFLGGMARMSKAGNDQLLREKAVFLMNEWGKTIAPDGYFFYSKRPNVYHYTYEKTIGGLNDLYEYAGEKQALVYVDQITDWAIENLDRSRIGMAPRQASEGGSEWYTLSENLYRAYLNTGDPKFKKFAEVWHYDQYWLAYAKEKPNADYLHAYSHVNTLSGAAMTYRVSGDPLYLKAIVNAYSYLQRTQCFATGGYGPREQLLPANGELGASLEARTDSFETPCGSWAGFKLSRYLMGFTGDARYGDWIERLAYNGIGAALPEQATGSTFYYSDYRLGGCVKVYQEETHRGETWPCCSGTYPQAVADYHNIIYFKDREGLYINLFIPSEVTWKFGEQDVVLQQQTSYPETDTVTVTIASPQAALFPLRFRVPAWAEEGVTVTINGRPEPVTATPGSWATVRRTWKPHDQMEIRLPLKFFLAPVDEQHPKRVALVRGPLVWVRERQPLSISDIPAERWKRNASLRFL